MGAKQSPRKEGVEQIMESNFRCVNCKHFNECTGPKELYDSFILGTITCGDYEEINRFSPPSRFPLLVFPFSGKSIKDYLEK